MNRLCGKPAFHGLIALVLLMLSGCATTPPKPLEQQTFFPPPPEPARLQFLVSYTGSLDIEAPRSAFATFVTGEKDRDQKLDKPYGVAIHDGKIYVCDTNMTVMVFDLQKRSFEPLQGAQGLGKLVQPINISIDRDGNKYVSDPVRQQVVMFDKNDFYVKAFGTPGEWKPLDAAVFEDRLYVADIRNSEIRVLDINTGEDVARLGKVGEPSEFLDKPTNLVIDKDGYLYVSDAGRFQIVKMDRDGHVLGTFGRVGTNLGHFARPKGVAVDREGRVFVVDAVFYNVQIFNPKGFMLLFFGGGGTKPGDLILPAKVIVDYANTKYFEPYVDPNFIMESLVLVTSQFGDRRVNVFAFGREKGRKYLTDDELLEQVRKIESTVVQKNPNDNGKESGVEKADGAGKTE